MKRRGIALNGRFLAAPASGVQRVAEELIKQIDTLLGENELASIEWTLYSPHDAKRQLKLARIEAVQSKKRRGQLWEQVELPQRAVGQLLINLCNQAPLWGAANIVMIHDAQAFIAPQSYNWAFRLWYRFSLPHICAKAEHVLTVSNYSRQKLIEYGIAPAEKISVIYNGIDHFANQAADKSCLPRLGICTSPYVVALANTQPHKNIAVLFEAFARLPPDWKLVLVGSADKQAFLQRGLAPPMNAIFAGKVTDPELRALYEGAICLAFPSTTEGFGLPPLEAMFVGCAAVVAPCGALPEICADAAMYVAPDDDKAWAKAIESLVYDKKLRDRLVAAGRLRASGFKWENSARQLLGVVSHIL